MTEPLACGFARDIFSDSLSGIAPSRWPHRAAVLLVCITFPLLWVGGLVTSTNAGMSVPDWPTTYGYNPFLYPLADVVLGPVGYFRRAWPSAVGSLIGMVTIGLVADHLVLRTAAMGVLDDARGVACW